MATKIAIITGASRGLGRNTAANLLRRGVELSGLTLVNTANVV